MKTKTLNECKEIIAIKHEYSDFAQIEMTDDEPWEKMETKGRIMCQAAELYASQFQQKDVQPLDRAIAEFTRLRSLSESKSIKDVVYLDGVLAVLEGIKNSEPNQEPPAPSKTLQDMPEKAEAILNEAVRRHNKTHDQAQWLHFDKNDKIIFIKAMEEYAGQSSPSLSKELVEYIKLRLEKDVSKCKELLEYWKINKEISGVYTSTIKQYEGFINELNQLTNGQ